MDISRTRAALKVSIGDGGDKTLLLRVRRHGNFIEWVSIIMIMMILAESLGAPSVYLHISGALLLLGRVAHIFGLKADNAAHPLRYVGNSANILSLLNAMVCVGINLLNL